MSQTAYQSAPQQEETEKKTVISENTTLARRVLAAAIALSLLVIGPLKLKAMRSSTVKDLKYNSSVTTEYRDDSVGYYVERSVDSAQQILNLVKAGGESAKADELEKLIKQVRAADETEMVKLYEEMYAKATELYTAYLRDDSSAKRYMDNLTSYSKTIATNAYWENADKFNSARNDIPGRLMALIWGIKEVPSK
ncbi:MAG: hypothetical protein IK019_02520 [Clostridia bacterium]|jgi:hypothetical protein|nr:hypothetical protein [Clostridia bacterium]MBR6008039.1 hypothetical protein [Clostridia bacterium]